GQLDGVVGAAGRAVAANVDAHHSGVQVRLAAPQRRQPLLGRGADPDGGAPGGETQRQRGPGLLVGGAPPLGARPAGRGAGGRAAEDGVQRRGAAALGGAGHRRLRAGRLAFAAGTRHGSAAAALLIGPRTYSERPTLRSTTARYSPAATRT